MLNFRSLGDTSMFESKEGCIPRTTYCDWVPCSGKEGRGWRWSCSCLLHVPRPVLHALPAVWVSITGKAPEACVCKVRSSTQGYEMSRFFLFLYHSSSEAWTQRKTGEATSHHGCSPLEIFGALGRPQSELERELATVAARDPQARGPLWRPIGMYLFALESGFIFFESSRVFDSSYHYLRAMMYC